MNCNEDHLTINVPSPFNDSARKRLKRMGVLDSEGRVSIRAMTEFTKIFAGLFFDDLRDFYETNHMLTTYETFKALSLKEEHQNMFLLMSILYDYMSKPLPDPVWWLAGESEAVTAFMIMLMGSFDDFMKNEGSLLSSLPRCNPTRLLCGTSM